MGGVHSPVHVADSRRPAHHPPLHDPPAPPLLHHPVRRLALRVGGGQVVHARAQGSQEEAPGARGGADGLHGQRRRSPAGSRDGVTITFWTGAEDDQLSSSLLFFSFLFISFHFFSILLCSLYRRKRFKHLF